MNEFNYDDSAYLAHHGIKGMKWGVRKDRSAYRTSDAIKSRLKKRIDARTFTRGDEKYLLTRASGIPINKAGLKASYKGKAKRLAVGAGVAGATLGAVAIGAGIAKHKKNKNRGGGYLSQEQTDRYMGVNNSGYSGSGNRYNDNDAYEAYIQRRRAKDIQNQMKNGRGINYI